MDRSSFRVFWLVPLFMTAHNVEEALFMQAALPKLNLLVAASPVRFLAPLSYPQFLAALGVVTAFPYIVCALGALGRLPKLAVPLLVLVQATMLVNVVFHVGAAFALRGYAPGLLSALLLNLPFSIWLLRRAMRNRWIKPATMRLLGLLTLVIHGPVLVAILFGAGAIGSCVPSGGDRSLRLISADTEFADPGRNSGTTQVRGHDINQLTKAPPPRRGP